MAFSPENGPGRRSQEERQVSKLTGDFVRCENLCQSETADGFGFVVEDFEDGE